MQGKKSSALCTLLRHLISEHDKGAVLVL